jgi:hypothetical protein
MVLPYDACGSYTTLDVLMQSLTCCHMGTCLFSFYVFEKAALSLYFRESLACLQRIEVSTLTPITFIFQGFEVRHVVSKRLMIRKFRLLQVNVFVCYAAVLICFSDVLPGFFLKATQLHRPHLHQQPSCLPPIIWCMVCSLWCTLSVPPYLLSVRCCCTAAVCYVTLGFCSLLESVRYYLISAIFYKR